MEFLLNGDAFGKNLTRLRKNRGLTRLKLAAMAEISVFDLIDMENGVRRRIPEEWTAKLCAVLETDLTTLLEGA